MILFLTLIFVLCCLKVADEDVVFRTKTDADKAIYQTLVRKNRRGSINNARRMYEDRINMKKVRQHMQNLVVVTNEEKLMEMSKVVEATPGKNRSFSMHF